MPTCSATWAHESPLVTLSPNHCQHHSWITSISLRLAIFSILNQGWDGLGPTENLAAVFLQIGLDVLPVSGPAASRHRMEASHGYQHHLPELMDNNQWFAKGENLDKRCMFYYSAYVHAMHTKALKENQSTVLDSILFTIFINKQGQSINNNNNISVGRECR